MASSRYLVDRLLAGIDFRTARHVVELGVGTGCVTREILARLHPDARLIAFEINPDFLRMAQQIDDPRLTVRNECASALPRVLAEEGIDEVDAIVSSLPLSILEDALVARILDASQASLATNGRFHQYQYSLSDYPELARRYGDVRVGFTMRNVPPAFVYECTEARGIAPRRPRIGPAMASVYSGLLGVVGLLIRISQEF